MTSQSTSIYTPFADGRTVHDIVEHSPALVNERWCRNLLRQVLQSLEQQYASGAPHRRISPDTLVMLNNGEALLLPASEDGAPAPGEAGAPTLADDLHALAMVLHYAITAELVPDGPIGPRLYDDYSDTLTKGIDRCLGPNLRLRPKTIPDMRALFELDTDAAPVAATSASLASAAPAPLDGLDDEGEDQGRAPVESEHIPEATGSAGIAHAAPPAPPFTPPPPTEPAVVAATVPDTASTTASATASATVPTIAPTVAPATMTESPTPGSATGAAATNAQARPEHAQAPQASPGGRSIPPSAHIRTSSVPPARGASQQRAPSEGGPDSNHGRIQRWAMMAGAAVVLLAAGSALVAFLQQSDSRDMVPLTLPPAERVANGLDNGETVVAPAAAPATPEGAAIVADAATATPGAAPAIMPGSVPGAVAPGVPVAGAVRAADAVVNGTTYKLMIKPWGTVYVNGVDRGVSPPVKRLTLGPGTHTIQIVNPNFPEHVRTLTAGNEEGATIEHDFTAQAE